jgi:SAM-dependent methyltransferase
MGDQIIGLRGWLLTPAGQYLLQWERQQLDLAVADVFGYHALQLGWPDIAGLQANRMPHQWLAVAHPTQPAPPGHAPQAAPQLAQASLVTDFAALPFAEASLDLLVLPHTLEFSNDPHATLREAARVLVPEGRVVICGLNPTSLWGWRQRRGHLARRLGMGSLYLPDGGDFIGYWRLRDWLRLLSFEVESGSFGCYCPAVRSAAWLDRMGWMDTLGPKYWPIFGAAYCVTAVKRVRGTRMLGAAWKKAPRLATAPVSVAPRLHAQAQPRSYDAQS